MPSEERFARVDKLVALFVQAGYDASLMIDDKIGVFVGVRLKDGEALPVLKVNDIKVIAMPVRLKP